MLCLLFSYSELLSDWLYGRQPVFCAGWQCSGSCTHYQLSLLALKASPVTWAAPAARSVRAASCRVLPLV